jgi:hypothetical protein
LGFRELGFGWDLDFGIWDLKNGQQALITFNSFAKLI